MAVQGQKITGEELKELKARVKAECLRRKERGSVAVYGDAAYDYVSSTNTGQMSKAEHYDKLSIPLNAIDKKGRRENSTNSRMIASDINNINTDLTSLEGKSMYAENLNGTGCATSCTGLCFGNCTGICTNTCSGCQGCTAACQNSCSGSCSGDCSGGCNDTCQACGGGCTATCAAWCDKGDCTTGCQGPTACNTTCSESSYP